MINFERKDILTHEIVSEMQNGSTFYIVLKGYFPLVSLSTPQKDSLRTNGHTVFLLLFIFAKLMVTTLRGCTSSASST